MQLYFIILNLSIILFRYRFFSIPQIHEQIFQTVTMIDVRHVLRSAIRIRQISQRQRCGATKSKSLNSNLCVVGRWVAYDAATSLYQLEEVSVS
jgi:hypothetical protein